MMYYKYKITHSSEHIKQRSILLEEKCTVLLAVVSREATTFLYV